MKLLLSLILSVAFARSHHRKAKAATPVHMTKVGSCEVKDASKMVYIIKQWHLAPKTATKGFKEKYPQEKNQTAIYQMLDQSVKKEEIQLIVSEGCEGEINSEFKPAFNGWDYSSLKAQANQKNYDKIITLVPLKVEAKYGDKIATFCGDKESLIQEGNLRLSNLRGWMGFYLRLTEFKSDPEKFKSYADSATKLLKVDKDLPPDQLLEKIKAQIKEDLGAFEKSLKDRDDSFVKTLQEHEYSKAAVVIGGLHAEDLKEKIQAAGLGCEVLEPPGYQRDDEKLIEDFRHALD